MNTHDAQLLVIDYALLGWRLRPDVPGFHHTQQFDLLWLNLDLVNLVNNNDVPPYELAEVSTAHLTYVLSMHTDCYKIK